MATILFIAAAGVLLTSLFLFFQAKQKERGYYKVDKNRTDYHQDNDDDFLSDLILRASKSRRDYYRDVYLKSAAWQRKRFVVLRRDNWTCVHCSRPATQVHHKRYAYRIGKEPIEWLESVCNACHDSLHQ